MDSQNCLSLTLTNWINPFVSIGYNTPFTQNFHPYLPQKDKLENNIQNFRKKFEEKKTFPKVIWSLYKRQIIWYIFIGLMKAICDNTVVLLMYFISNLMEDFDKLEPENRDIIKLSILFTLVVISQLISVSLQNYSTINLKRISLKILGC